MSTRVIGRGKCPRCGRIGSLVFKEISGNIYVYFKHGREWCYIGPASRVDLSSLISGIELYHTFTTKFRELLEVHLGGLRLKLMVTFMIGVILLISAYCISFINLDGYYSSVSLMLTSISSLTFMLSIALYEKSITNGKYVFQVRVLKRSLIAYVILTAFAILIVTILALPLKSPVNMWFKYKMVIGSAPIKPHSHHVGGNVTATSIGKAFTYRAIHLRVPLASIIVASTILTYMLRPLSLMQLVLCLIVSPFIAYLILFTLSMIPLLILGLKFMEALSFIVYSSINLSIPVVLLSIALMLLVNVLLKIYSIK